MDKKFVENTNTVKEFLSMHKGQKVSLMTPDGCVNLDENGTNVLLSGQPTNVYPGTNCYAVKVAAIRLLEQKVIRSVFNTMYNSWFLLTDYNDSEDSKYVEQTEKRKVLQITESMGKLWRKSLGYQEPFLYSRYWKCERYEKNVLGI